MHLVDTNVLGDVAARDPVWFDWSAEQLERFAPTGLGVNQVILAEVSAFYDTAEAVDEFLPRSQFERLELPWEAAFLTSRAFLAYRRTGGPRLVPIPDFYIGAHAMVSGLGLITRDAKTYRTYFPELELVSPS